MALPPFYLLPQGSSFHRLPDFSTAKSRIELVTDHLVRAGLYFHWIQRTQALDPARLSTEISSAVRKITSVYESCAYLHSHCFSLDSMPVAEKVALFLLHLEDGSFSKELLVAEFDALDPQCKDFLVQIVARFHRIPVEDANAVIHQNPCLLLQLENSKSENVLEVLLESLDQRESVRTELNKLAIYKSDPDQLKIQLTKSPFLSLFSWFVWYDEGGKDDLTFASSNYGQERIDEDPGIIFKLRGLELFCSSLEVGHEDEFFLKAEEKQRDPLIKKMVELVIQNQFNAVVDALTVLGIQDENFRIDIAKLCAQQNAEDTAEHINKFEIADQKALIEIAKLCAKKDKGMLENIKKFKIEDQEALIEIAKLYAQNNFLSMFMNIEEFRENFKITDQEPLLDIAKLCAQNCSSTPYYIEKFGITDKEALRDIAKICAQKYPSETARSIKKFEITAQEVLIDIAKLCAQKNAAATAEFIGNFGIIDQQGLIEIAKLCAQQNTCATAKKIRNFGISHQLALIDIAKLCAQQDAGATAGHINKFGITDQVALIYIAKLCAQQDARATAEHINKFGITDQVALIYIAKLCAQEAARATAEHINKFGITDQEALIDIAKLYARQAPIHTAINITSFGIVDKKALISIEILCLMVDIPKQRVRANDPTIFKTLTTKYSGVSILEEDFLEKALSEFYPKKAGVGASPQTNPILLFLDKERKKCVDAKAEEDSPLIQNYRLHYLMALYLSNENKAEDPSGVARAGAGGPPEETEESKLGKEQRESALEKILALRSRPLQVYLTVVLSEVSKDPFLSARFISMQKDEEHLTASFQYALPILLVAASWSKNIVEPEKVAKGKKSVFATVKGQIQSSLSANREAIKNASSGLAISCLSALNGLDSTPLTGEEKLHLFKEICRASPRKEDVTQFESSLKYLTLLCKMQFFKGGISPSFKDEFTFATLKDIAIEQGKLSLFGDEVLSAEDQGLLEGKYLDLSEKQRRPLALELYASRMRELKDERVNKSMSRFIKSVLRGSFKVDRYDPSLSLHISAIKTGFPAIWDHWRSLRPPVDLVAVRGLAGPARGGVSAGAAAVEDHRSPPEIEKESYRWLRQTLNTPGHLPEGITIPTEISSFLGSDEMLESAEALSKHLNTEIPNREMYMLCLNLCKKGIPLEKTLSILKELQKRVSAEPSMIASQWKTDIDYRISILSTEQKMGSLEVLITDDWQDLFLCGTEVLGSCQSIDGDTSLNKGLLGYCLDGKIQMVAVKDKESGKIRSRALLKLLIPSGGGKPALFLERIYPDPCPDEQVKALNQFGIQRARELGLDLYTENRSLPVLGDRVSLQSLGCPAPFEYEDAGGNGPPNGGVYTISSFKVVLPPS